MVFGHHHVLRLAYDFLWEYPEITLNVLSLDRVVNLVDEHVDVGVRLGELADSSLYAVKVGDFGFVTCASPEYLARKGRPSSPEDLVNHDGVVFGQITVPGWIYQCKGRRLEGKPNIRVFANTATAAVTAAARGVAIIRAPVFHVASELQSGALVTILNGYESESFPVHLVYVRQGLLPLKVRAFIDWITPRLRRVLKDLAAFNSVGDRPGG
jgi:DNA-binding transcriptional LysR family regulator